MQKGNSAYIKKINKQLVLKWIINEKSTSRASISKALSISKPTISAIVDQLLEEGWIYETGNGVSSTSGGRKPVNIKFNPKKAYIIGIDIGGTKIAIGITDLNGNVCGLIDFPTQQYLDGDIFTEIKIRVEALKKELQIDDSKILGMGVGVPGVVEVETGIVHEAPAMGWRDFPVGEKLHSQFAYPVYIDNDVNISVLGEHWKGVGIDKKNLVYIAIGTGIGSGIMINGELYRGSNNSAGEIGYMVTDREYARTYQPIFEGYGFLESVSGGSSIGSKLSARIGKEITAKDAFDLYVKNDKDAVEVVDFAIENLSLGIANYISLLDPELIVLGGGVSESYPVISRKMEDIISRFTPRKCEVVQTSFGKEAGVIGAVALFLKEYDSIYKI
ncbi:ROK family transcriptional regulator [Oceanobacillus chungangensis]|uniref:Glucokinase n=1 Tax=Oceanobacillus chungangensis TaxID=1229152 RepID=A0A3D8PX59_9BACI|nr:ROK family transcriptional regulator [Oceanobacillus chungangensis]RDW20614.1 glucokinase [Oceanobacillus chungangensis]